MAALRAGMGLGGLRLGVAGPARLRAALPRLFVSPMQRVGALTAAESGPGFGGRCLEGLLAQSRLGVLAASSSSATASALLGEARQGLNALLRAGLWLIKRTFQPSLIRRKRKHGFLARAGTKDGVHVLNRRRQKGRRKLCA